MRICNRSLAIVIWAVAFFVTAGFVFPCSSFGEKAASGSAQPESKVPTAVAGESWLVHLGRSFDDTSMGKTGQLGPAVAAQGGEFARWQTGLVPESANGVVTLHGSDLYRMNCRGCHGENGGGAPPEINSVINPVRATSAAAVMERMKSAGMDMSRADAAKLAQQSHAMLLERLHRGGQDMPAFPHLREAEVNSLVAYLRQLAGVRGADAAQLAVREPRVQVGEHIVKSTCHICHSAAGPNPNPQQLSEGAIPPLNTLALRTSRAEFIRKVTHGAPVVMGAPPQLYRGRMPVFYYLSEAEAADVYLYLTSYPPYQWATLESGPTFAAAVSLPDESTPDSTPRTADVAFVANAAHTEVGPPARDASAKLAILPILAGLIVTALLVFAFGFTVCELKRLSATKNGRRQTAGRMSVESADAAGGFREGAKECRDCELVA